MSPAWRTLKLPLALILLWCLLLFALYHWTVRREDEYTRELALLQTRTLFSSLVDVRAWNAVNGGVWVQEGAACPANPWLPEAARRLSTADGKRLVKVNPSYMTRQIAEAISSPLASFRISGLAPMRPENQADSWEAAALTAFMGDEQERFDLVENEKGMEYRFMAPLRADETCLHCHTTRTIGDVLGGISVSLSAEPLLKASSERNHTSALAFSLVGIVGIVGIGGATLQINRKKELAEAANRTKSAFLANMSHDMRTPLAGILGMAELLEHETDNARHRYLLSNLAQATTHLLDTVDGIMRYSLLEAEGKEVSERPFSLREELAACVNTLLPACQSRNIRLQLDLSPALPDRLLGDGFRLRQAIGNLLGNAVKFTDQGSVTLHADLNRTERTAQGTIHELSFRVQDTGPGVPPEEQSRIFESFEQGSGARPLDSPIRAGVGLGLSIARHIARRFGGDLTLVSQPGKGSTFTLTGRFRGVPESDDGNVGKQPVRQREPLSGAELLHQTSMSGRLPAETPFERTPQAGASIPLVVVEDTPITALYLHEVLRKAGYGVHVANCGEDARFLLEKIRPAAALLDIRLPDMSGLDVAEQIRSGKLDIPADLPLLLLTATLDERDARRLAELRVDAWFIKPVSRERLLAALSALVGTASLKTGRAAGNRTNEIPVSRETQERTGHAAPQPGQNAIFNRGKALAGLEEEGRLRRMSLLFVAEAAQSGLTLRELSAAPDSPERRARLGRLAHSLKNNAAALCLPRLRDAAAALEQAVSASRTSATDLLRLTETTHAALYEACSLLRELYGD